jgi:hypothetical protein
MITVFLKYFESTKVVKILELKVSFFYLCIQKRKMLSKYFHSLYAGNPVLLLVLICFFTVVMWIGMGEFYTKGEPREASVAVSMIERGQWVLPEVYAGETAYKPPFTHWLTAVFSIPSGKVSPFTSRLPSALAFTGMIIAVFLFYRKCYSKEVAFFTCLIMITCFELHRAAMTSRVDMMLTSLTVFALVMFFGWERKQLSGFPVPAALAMSCAALTKGPVGIMLPMLVFGIYLIVLRYNLLKIVLKLLPVVIASFVLPAVWYYFAYIEGGQPFLDLVWAENFGRLLGQKDLPINYALGHEEGWWYNFLTLAAGFLPWTLVLFVTWKDLLRTVKFLLRTVKHLLRTVKHLLRTVKSSLRTVKHLLRTVKPSLRTVKSSLRTVKHLLKTVKPSLRTVKHLLRTVKLSLRTVKHLLRTVKFSLKTVKHLLITVFMKLFGGLKESMYKIKSDRPTLFSLIAAAVTVGFYCIPLSKRSVYLMPAYPFIAFFIARYVLYLKNKAWLKHIYRITAAYIVLWTVIDAVALPIYKNSITQKPFAECLKQKYPALKKNVYAMNNLLEYSNMYGLNFYLDCSLRDFEKDRPDEGYLLIGNESFERVDVRYGGDYRFEQLECYENKCRDGEKKILLVYFKKT